MQILFIIPFALGLYLLLAATLRLPNRRAVVQLRAKQKTSLYSDLTQMLSAKLAQFVPMSDFEQERLSATLNAAEIAETPKQYMCAAYIKTAVVLLLLLPCLWLMPISAVVVLLFAVKVYRSSTGRADELLASRKRNIAAELPRFAATIATELQNSRDIITILDTYKQNAAEPLKTELFRVVSDMRSGSYEQALSRLEIRVDLPELSEIVRGLMAVIGGNDGRMHFTMLAKNLRVAEIAKLKEQAKAIAPKIRRCSQVLLVFFVATYLVVMGMEIFATLTTMFV